MENKYKDFGQQRQRFWTTKKKIWDNKEKDFGQQRKRFWTTKTKIRDSKDNDLENNYKDLGKQIKILDNKYKDLFILNSKLLFMISRDLGEEKVCN